MKHLPNKRTPRQDIIIKACSDYYGVDIDIKENMSAKKIAIWLMGRKKNIEFTSEELSDLWAIRANLSDDTYIKSLME